MAQNTEYQTSARTAPPHTMNNTVSLEGNRSYETIISEKARACLDALAHSMQSSMELRKKAAKDSILREQAEEQVKTLSQCLQSQERERKPEMSQILDLATTFVRARQDDVQKRELGQQVETLRLELDCARDESERVKERYREALVSSTRSSLQTSQLAEELDVAKQQAAKAERNAVREARKATLATDEKNNLAKRCEQLEKQLNQMRAQNTQLTEQARRVTLTGSSAGFANSTGGYRVKPVDEPLTSTTSMSGQNSNRAAKGAAARSVHASAGSALNSTRQTASKPKDARDTKRNKISQQSRSNTATIDSVFEREYYEDDDPEQAEFDFV